MEVDGKVVVPAGTEALGKVVEAPQGHFKGAAVLPLVLETVTVNNDSCDVKTSSVSRYLKGKRTATLIGGGAGGGALIGGLAGGGKGALIGAALGAGARTAGAAYIEEKEIVLPAESTLSFKLTQPVTVKMSPHITVEVLLNLPLVGYLYRITSRRRLLEELRMHSGPSLVYAAGLRTRDSGSLDSRVSCNKGS